MARETAMRMKLVRDWWGAVKITRWTVFSDVYKWAICDQTYSGLQSRRGPAEWHEAVTCQQSAI